VRAFGAFEAKRLFSAPPSPNCDRKGAPMTDTQDHIRPTRHDLKASAKAQYDPARNRCPQSEMARARTHKIGSVSAAR